MFFYSRYIYMDVAFNYTFCGNSQTFVKKCSSGSGFWNAVKLRQWWTWWSLRRVKLSLRLNCFDQKLLNTTFDFNAGAKDEKHITNCKILQHLWILAIWQKSIMSFYHIISKVGENKHSKSHIYYFIYHLYV